MIKMKQAIRAVPGWARCLSLVLAAWLLLAGTASALSGSTTLDVSVGDVSITAALPVTYAPLMDGEDYVFDEDGNVQYAYSPIDGEKVASVVAWSFDGEAGTLSGEVCAFGHDGCLGGYDLDSVLATVVFTNNHAAADMILSFDYSYTTSLGTGGKLEGLISGGNVSESGTVTASLAPGESAAISLYSGSAQSMDDLPGEYGNCTLNLSNLTVTNANETQTATLTPANNGMYRADFVNADGDVVSYVLTTQPITPELQAEYSGATVVAESQPIEYRLSGGLTLTDLGANANFRFDHWQGGTVNLGSESPATVIPANGGSVTAVYQQESYINAFTVGNQTYYSWNAAVTDALNSHNPIILNQNYSFPANAADAVAAGETLGNYVTVNGSSLNYALPSGVRFVVPKSAGDFGNFTNVLPTGVTSTTPITHFRTLTIPAGVTLQVNGEISVNGDYYCKQPYETVAGGAHGLVSLNENAKINVSNGGKIWCYGFIAGAGEVAIASGGHAAEFLQICDWGGGNAALTWATNTDNLFNAFYFSQYYVQNIEAQLTVYEGATTEVAVAIVANGSVANSHAPFIGEGGLFHLTSSGGHITRIYDASTDRTAYNIYGDMETSGITVGVMQYKLSSDSYVLGVNGNLDLNIESGTTTMLNDFMLLPGTEVNVADGASVEIAQSAPMAVTNPETGETEIVQRPVRMFIIDDYEWNYQIPEWDDEKSDMENLLAQICALADPTPTSYSYGGSMRPLPYTVINGTANSTIRPEYEESATINIDGDATFYGNVFTTNYIGNLVEQILALPAEELFALLEQAAEALPDIEDPFEVLGILGEAYEGSMDKLITGTGTIVNNPPMEGIDGSLNLLTQDGKTKTQVSIPTSGVLGPIDEETGLYFEFGTGTYHSDVDEDGNAVWYKNRMIVRFADAETGDPIEGLDDLYLQTIEDYTWIYPDDIYTMEQRYVIVGFSEASDVIPLGFVPYDYIDPDPEAAASYKLVNNGQLTLGEEGYNCNFVVPDWDEFASDENGKWSYLQTNGLDDGWETAAFALGSLGNSGVSFPGGLVAEITVLLSPYDYAVYWENEREQSVRASFLYQENTASFEIDGEADFEPEIINIDTGSAATDVVCTVHAENVSTTISLSGIASDLVVCFSPEYTKVPLVWRFVDAEDESVVYATEETVYEITEGPALSPVVTDAAHRYLLLHGDQHTKLAERYPDFTSVVTLSNGASAAGTAADLQASLTNIDEPLTVTVKVDPYDYKVTFADDRADASIEDFYAVANGSLTLGTSDIVSSGKYCFDEVSVSGYATAEVVKDGAELSLTGIGSDSNVAVTLKSYDCLVQFRQAGVTLKYDFVDYGATASYTYPANTYDSGYTNTLNAGNQPNEVTYTPALEGQPAEVRLENVNRDREINLNPVSFDRAVFVYDENSVLKRMAYANGAEASVTYSYGALYGGSGVNAYVLNVTNPNGATVVDQLDQQTAIVTSNGTGYFPVTLELGTYYHVVEFRYFQPDGTINGTQLKDSNNVMLSTRIFVEEEDGTVSVDTDDFLEAYQAGGNAVSMYQAAGEKIFLFNANYFESGSGHTNTYTTAADGKTLTVSDIGKNAFVNVMVVPYANTLTVTDSGLGTTSLYYVDANGYDLTNSYKAAGTAPVTYNAGQYRTIFGATVTNASIDATSEELAAGVDSVTVTGYTGDATLTVDSLSTKHKLTVQYIDPWGTTSETAYPQGEVYMASFTDREIIGAVVTTEDGSTATYTTDGFTVTMPDEPTVTRVTVQFRYVAEPGTASERLKIDVVNGGQFNNATGSNATITVTDAYYGEFTVACPKACVIAYTTDNGATYHQLDADRDDGDPANTYTFTLSNETAWRENPSSVKLAVVVKGDIDGNGRITAVDATRVKSASISKWTFSAIELLGADVDGNGRLTAIDATRVKSASISKWTFDW